MICDVSIITDMLKITEKEVIKLSDQYAMNEKLSRRHFPYIRKCIKHIVELSNSIDAYKTKRQMELDIQTRIKYFASDLGTQ